MKALATDLEVSTDKSRLDIELIFQFLTNEARWCLGIGRETVEKGINNSLCFGAYLNGKQVGFARVVTDYATFGNLVDVFVINDFRGLGFAKEILRNVVQHPDLVGLRRFMLATSDKQEFYRKFGFETLDKPGIFMEKFKPDIYKNG